MPARSISNVPTPPDERVWLLSALSGSPSWPPAWPVDTQRAVEHLLATAREEGVAVPVFYSIRNQPCWGDLPAPLQQGLFSTAKKAIAWDITSRKIITKTFEALTADGIDYLLLKGAGLAHLLYPSPHFRARGDTDLLLADRQTADRAWSVLNKLGYEKAVGVEGRFVSHQFACSKPGPQNSVITLDIHWKLSNSNFFARKFGFTDLWAERRAVEALGPHTVMLSARHALIHALFHRAWHLGEGDPERLIWLYDIHLLCGSFNSRGWQNFIEEVNRRGLQPICRNGLRDVSTALGTTVPPKVYAGLSEDPTNGFFNQMDLKNPGARRKLADLLSLPTWPERIKLIREHLFPDAAYMQERFGADAPRKLPLAYLRRAARGLTKQLHPNKTLDNQMRPRSREEVTNGLNGEAPDQRGKGSSTSSADPSTLSTPSSFSSCRIQINPAVVFQEIEGESVLLHTIDSRYFGLDEIGTRAWQLFNEQYCLEEVMRIMLTEYEVEPKRLRADLRKLVGALSAKGLVNLTEEEQASLMWGLR